MSYIKHYIELCTERGIEPLDASNNYHQSIVEEIQREREAYQLFREFEDSKEYEDEDGIEIFDND